MPRMKVRYVDPQPIAQTVFNYPSTWKLDCKELYVDPQPIAQTVFNYPSTWKLDCKELAAGEIVEEKEKIRTRIIREESLKVQLQVSWTLYLKIVHYIFVRCKATYMFIL
jgi:hypothetical protein